MVFLITFCDLDICEAWSDGQTAIPARCPPQTPPRGSKQTSSFCSGGNCNVQQYLVPENLYNFDQGSVGTKCSLLPSNLPRFFCDLNVGEPRGDGQTAMLARSLPTSRVCFYFFVRSVYLLFQPSRFISSFLDKPQSQVSSLLSPRCMLALIFIDIWLAPKLLVCGFAGGVCYGGDGGGGGGDGCFCYLAFSRFPRLMPTSGAFRRKST